MDRAPASSPGKCELVYLLLSLELNSHSHHSYLCSFCSSCCRAGHLFNSKPREPTGRRRDKLMHAGAFTARMCCAG